MSSHNQERPTFLKVFVEVPDPIDEKSDDNCNTGSTGSKGKSSSSSSYLLQKTKSTQSQYCTITITSSSSASDVCNAVARKRNLLYTLDDFELVMCDGDGQASYETILCPYDQPHQFQQSAAKHGHLGDFHFVFRKSNGDETDLDDDSHTDSEPDIFGTMPQQIKHGKYPASWMEKRGKNHKAWRRRYFVLIDNELLYYKRRDVYEHNKEPIARIELVNPPGIIKILPPETIRKNNISKTQTLFLFDIHTPKRVYSLRIDNYNDMIFWVKILSRRNEPNELIDGLDSLVCQSEQLHSNDDEKIMEKFSTLEAILCDKHATDAYMKYLQSIHNEEFIHFWLDLNKYLNDYITTSKDTQKRFAIELYEKYIKSNAKYQLSEIKSKHRSTLKKQIESGLITKNMFNDIKHSIFHYLNRDSGKFFNSSEYFRFIVTYKHSNCTENNENVEENNNLQWPHQFEQKIESNNREKHKYIMSSNQNILHNHSAKYSLKSYPNTLHSPVLIDRRSRPQSPVHQGKVGKLYKNGSHSSSHGSYGNTLHANSINSWTIVNHNENEKGQKEKDGKKHKKRSRSKHSFGKSVFDNAPGVAHPHDSVK